MLPRQEPRWSPVDDNQAAQACFESSCCRLARRFAHERDEMDRPAARNSGRTMPEPRRLVPAGSWEAAGVWLDVGLRRCCHIWHAVMGQPGRWDPSPNHSARSGAAPSPIDTHNLTIWRAVDIGDWARRQSGDLLFGDCLRGESMPATPSVPFLQPPLCQSVRLHPCRLGRGEATLGQSVRSGI